MSIVRPVSTDVKHIDVAMVIPCQEGVSCGVKGHMEEMHRLGLLSSADHRHQHTEEGKQHTLKGKHTKSESIQSKSNTFLWIMAAL